MDGFSIGCEICLDHCATGVSLDAARKAWEAGPRVAEKTDDNGAREDGHWRHRNHPAWRTDHQLVQTHVAYATSETLTGSPQSVADASTGTEVIPIWRTIVLCGRYLERHEQGPMIYSGFDLRHPECARTPKLQRGSLAFWFWVPPKQRRPWAGTSLVPDIKDHERARLAEGELLEVRHNYVTPLGLSTDGFLHWLWPIWIKKSEEQTGFVPEQAVRRMHLDLAPQALKLEQDRSKIILTGFS
jgi:hypothetical protein